MAANNQHAAALRHLKQVDSKLAQVIKDVGPCRWRRRGGTYELLAKSILSQQISVAAAATICRRLHGLMPNGRLSATQVAKLSESELTAVGVSRQKRAYLGDLTQRVVDGRINFRRLAQLQDHDVISELVEVKGVGVWTAQMFLMFGLGRPDIFAFNDLGLQNAVKAVYGHQKANHKIMEKVSIPWAPFRSVASWYLWRSLELKNN